MSKDKSGITLYNREATFGLNTVGNKTGDQYMGTFKVKCILSPLEEISADRRYRELLGPNSHLASERVRTQAFALSQLEQRLVEYPPFWENDVIGGGHLEDDNVLSEVLDRAIESQEKYMQAKKEELAERQSLLTKAIKNNEIEREPEIENIDESRDETEEEVEI